MYVPICLLTSDWRQGLPHGLRAVRAVCTTCRRLPPAIPRPSLPRSSGARVPSYDAATWRRASVHRKNFPLVAPLIIFASPPFVAQVRSTRLRAPWPDPSLVSDVLASLARRVDGCALPYPVWRFPFPRFHGPSPRCRTHREAVVRQAGTRMSLLP